MASTLGFEPVPHWWEASALTTASPLLPVTLHLSRREFKVPHRSFVLQTADDGLLSLASRDSGSVTPDIDFSRLLCLDLSLAFWVS